MACCQYNTNPIFWGNTGLLSIDPSFISFSGILSKIQLFSFIKIHLNGDHFSFCLDVLMGEHWDMAYHESLRNSAEKLVVRHILLSVLTAFQVSTVWSLHQLFSSCYYYLIQGIYNRDNSQAYRSNQQRDEYFRSPHFVPESKSPPTKYAHTARGIDNKTCQRMLLQHPMTYFEVLRLPTVNTKRLFTFTQTKSWYV